MATKVLLVEDDADQALLFSRVLERIGYAVTQTTTAARAQAYLRTEPYALLLADWDLGGGMAGEARGGVGRQAHIGVDEQQVRAAGGLGQAGTGVDLAGPARRQGGRGQQAEARVGHRHRGNQRGRGVRAGVVHDDDFIRRHRLALQ